MYMQTPRVCFGCQIKLGREGMVVDGRGEGNLLMGMISNRVAISPQAAARYCPPAQNSKAPLYASRRSEYVLASVKETSCRRSALSRRPGKQE